MQSVTTGFTDAVMADFRQPGYVLTIKWDGTNWVDETAYLELDFSGSQAISANTDDLVAPGDVGELSFRLNNFSGRFSFNNTSGALYSYIGGATGMSGKEVRLNVLFGGGTCRIFTGVIAETYEDTVNGLVSIKCRDMGYKYLQNKLSTPMYQNLLTSEYIYTLAVTHGGMAPAATMLDTAFTRIPWAWLDDESVIEEIWQAAQAEGARVYFDQMGVLRFENATHWLGHTNVWTFTYDDFENMQPKYSTDGLASKIICEYSPRYPSVDVVLYSLDRARVIRPGEAITIEARFSQPAYRVIQPSSDQNKDYYIATTAGINMKGSCSVTVTDVYGQRANVVITNTHATDTAVVYRFQVRGTPLVGAQSDQVTVVNGAPPAGLNRTRTARNNTYVQTDIQARIVAEMLLTRYARLTPIYPLSGVPGVPQLELGDLVTVVEPHTGQSIQGFVTSIRFRCANGAFIQDLEIMRSTDPFFGSTNYFKFGVTALGTSGIAWV